HSSARFRADRTRQLDLGRDAPLSGTYGGVWGMGLVASLTTASPAAVGFSWPKTRPTSFDINVVLHGHTVARAEVRRELPRVSERSLSVARAGFYGRYFAPVSGSRVRGAPVLIFGGSEGGLSFRLNPALLAARGHPALSLAYFD